MSIDLSRHRGIFDPAKFNLSIAIIGVGSIGSRLILHLAELGVEKLFLFDPDKVSRENIANQAFREKDVGKYKVVAMKEILREKGFEGNLLIYPEESSQICGDILFVCVDSMKTRKEIYKNQCNNSDIRYYFDARVGITSISVYAFYPQDKMQSKRYAESLYDDKKIPPACGRQSIGVTAQFAASFLTTRFIERVTEKRKVFAMMYDWSVGFYKEYLD
jgi:molybdopterin/thiamine biosynthesis adenylyltransferase